MMAPGSILDLKIIYIRISNQPDDWVYVEAAIGR